jgi:hypothetical protein
MSVNSVHNLGCVSLEGMADWTSYARAGTLDVVVENGSLKSRQSAAGVV